MTVELVPQPHMGLDGVDGRAETADKTQLDITGDIEVVANTELGSLTTKQTLVGKWGDSDRSYRFGITAGGNLELVVSENGTTEIVASSSLVMPVAIGEAVWLRVVLDSVTGDVIFYTSSDPITTVHTAVSWTQLGALQNIGAVFLHVGALTVTGGSDSDGTNPLIGRLYGLWLYGDDGVSSLFFDDFTGADGDPWDPAKWPTIDSDGTIDIQLNRGRCILPTGSFAGSSLANSGTFHADAEIRVDQFADHDEPDGRRWIYYALRSSGEVQPGSQFRPVNCYYLRVRTDRTQVAATVTLQARVDNADITIDGFDLLGVNEKSIRWQVIGDQLKVKVWRFQDPEPGPWDLEVTDTQITEPGVGQVIFRAFNNTEGGYEASIDDFSLETLG